MPFSSVPFYFLWTSLILRFRLANLFSISFIFSCNLTGHHFSILTFHILFQSTKSLILFYLVKACFLVPIVMYLMLQLNLLNIFCLFLVGSFLSTLELVLRVELLPFPRVHLPLTSSANGGSALASGTYHLCRPVVVELVLVGWSWGKRNLLASCGVS